MKICKLCNKPKQLSAEDEYCENCKEDIEILGLKKAKELQKEVK